MLKMIKVKSEQGFTLIEMLVVVIVIGILVSIAIPLFLQQREKAHVATVKSDVRNAVLADTVRKSSNGSGLPNSPVGSPYAGGDNLGDGENSFRVSRGVEITVTGTEITGTHNAFGAADTWTYHRDSGEYEGGGVFAP